jgi:hypothetical protein
MRRDDGGPGEFGAGASGADRLDNGLRASKYVPLTDVDTAVGQLLLSALGRARIAAYLDSSAEQHDQQRLFVASDERVDARTIVAAAVRALNGSEPGDSTDAAGGGPELPGRHDPFDDIDTDAAFRALVADWHVDTIAAVRDAERDLSREDADWRARLAKPQASDEVWLDEDHYVPPPPPPLPRLTTPTIGAIAVSIVSILVLAFGVELGFDGDFVLLLGCGGLVAAACILFTRIRDHHRDEDDDGSAI